jgi:hypothetical protein
MKKPLLLTVALVVVASSAFAQTGASGTTFGITPSSQFVNSNSSFNVSLSLSGIAPPSPLDGFDLWIVTSSANSGLFSIVSASYASPFTFFGASTTFNDPINTPTTSAFVVNTADLGNISTSQALDPSSPYSNVPLITTLTISTGALTPGATYTFFTSTSATATGNTFNRYSDVLDQAGGTWTVPAAQFSITAVPEPSTWAMGVLGVGVIGYVFLRRRRVA